ncbi:unnamed protein product [Peniophora sp. CBMAI 1063]|nr:unnamed protein product [Peniophora sp. CBMAI 1063]
MSSSELSGALDPSAISHNPYYVQYRTQDGYYYHTQPLQAEPPPQLEQPQQHDGVYNQPQPVYDEQAQMYGAEPVYVGYQQNPLSQADIAPLQSSVSSLESALEAERVAREKLERRLTDCANELRGLQATFLSALEAQQSAAQAQLERALQHRNQSDGVWRGELEQRMEEMAEHGKRADERCARLEEHAAVLEEKNDRLEARNTVLEDRCARAESRLATLEARAQSAEDTVRRAEDLANEAQSEAREANDRIDALFKEHNMLKSARMAPPASNHGLPSPRSLPSTSPMFANAMPTPAASTPARPTSPAVYRPPTQSSLAQPVASSSAVTLDKVSAYDAPASPSLFPQAPFAYSPTTSSFPSRISSPQPTGQPTIPSAPPHQPPPPSAPPSTRGQKRLSDDEPKDTRPTKKRDHHDKRPHTVQTAMRKHMWLVMNIPEDSFLPEPHPEGTPIPPNEPVRFNWAKTIKQSKHNQAMKTRVLSDIRARASELYPEVPSSDIMHNSIASIFDSAYTTVRGKWKQQNDAAEKEKVRLREAGKSQRARRVGRKKTKLTGRQDARKRKAEFSDRRFDGAMQVDCMSSEESDAEDAGAPTARVGAGAGTGGDDSKTLVLRGRPWRSSRLLRFYGALDAEDHRYVDMRPRRGVGRRLRKEGEPREKALPPSGVSRWMVSRRWMARMQREDPLALEALEFADDEADNADWSRYEMLGYESEDEEAGFLDERGAQVARNAPNYSLMGALAGPSDS